MQRLRRKFQDWAGYASLFADLNSFARFAVNRRRLFGERVLNGSLDDMLQFRVRALHGGLIWCRRDSTDFLVAIGTFQGRYHLPPEELRPVRTILDLGSNIGLTMAHYAVLFPEARILGIELDRANVEVCRRNIASYGNRCEIIWGAAWPEEGAVGYGGSAEYGFHVTSAQPRAQVQAYSVPTLIRRLGSSVVDFVKMDIEGAEQALFTRRTGWLENVRCVKVEIHDPYSVEECIRDLTKLGLDCQVFERHWASVIAWNTRLAARSF